MHKPAITLDPDAKIAVLDSIVSASCKNSIHLRCIAVSSNHVHALLRIDPDRITVIVGSLKRSSSHAIRVRLPGRVWAGRHRADPVRDREYLANVEAYILAHHRKECAATWHDRIGYSG